MADSYQISALSLQKCLKRAQVAKFVDKCLSPDCDKYEEEEDDDEDSDEEEEEDFISKFGKLSISEAQKKTLKKLVHKNRKLNKKLTTGKYNLQNKKKLEYTVISHKMCLNDWISRMRERYLKAIKLKNFKLRVKDLQISTSDSSDYGQETPDGMSSSSNDSSTNDLNVPFDDQSSYDNDPMSEERKLIKKMQMVNAMKLLRCLQLSKILQCLLVFAGPKTKVTFDLLFTFSEILDMELDIKNCENNLNNFTKQLCCILDLLKKTDY